MSKSDDNLGLVELIGGVALLLGLCAAGVSWWRGQSLWDSLLVGFVLTMGAGLIALTADGFKTGKMGVRGGYIYRSKQPVFFWGCAMFYLAAAIGLLGLAATGLLVLFSGP
ncbi:MAG: hypothetical protein Kow0031_09440 [Anaerolineae bacterium]